MNLKMRRQAELEATQQQPRRLLEWYLEDLNFEEEKITFRDLRSENKIIDREFTTPLSHLNDRSKKNMRNVFKVQNAQPIPNKRDNYGSYPSI